MIVNGWSLYYYGTFKAALDELEAVVTRLALDDPAGYKSHPRTRLLASVYRAITRLVPANPDAPEFRLGKTLGSDKRNWRRVKKGMPDQYRLFFRFASGPVKVNVYVWFNDQDTLRKTGSKTDVYETFRRMLARGVVPARIDELLAGAHQATQNPATDPADRREVAALRLGVQPAARSNTGAKAARNRSTMSDKGSG